MFVEKDVLLLKFHNIEILYLKEFSLGSGWFKSVQMNKLEKVNYFKRDLGNSLKWYL